MKIAPFSYTSPAPDGYFCSKCGATACKLWRQYNTFADHINLMCAVCASRDQKTAGNIDDEGKVYNEICGQRIDQIGSLIPAVPTEDGTTYWGYTSAPLGGVLWWNALPSYPKAETVAS